MTIVTPWLTPATSMPQVSAWVASRWVAASMVNIRLRPGVGSRIVSFTRVRRPEASRSTSWVPYVPRSSASNDASTPSRPMVSSGRYPASASRSSSSPETGPV